MEQFYRVQTARRAGAEYAVDLSKRRAWAVDLSVTAANVLASSSAVKERGVAGATITAGQTLYIDTSDSNKLKLADCDSATAAVRNCAGIALNGAAAGQPVEYVIEDPSFTPGGTLTVGTTYVLSDTAGGIMPHADLESGDYPTVLFIATTTALAVMKMVKGTVAI